MPLRSNNLRTVQPVALRLSVCRMKDAELTELEVESRLWRQRAALLTLEDWSDIDVSSVGRPPNEDLNAMRMTDSIANIAAVTSCIA